MTPSELKRRYEENGGEHFFSRDTMRFFGDTMKNYGVRSATVDGEEFWELFRKRPVKHGLQASAFFRKSDPGYTPEIGDAVVARRKCKSKTSPKNKT